MGRILTELDFGHRTLECQAPNVCSADVKDLNRRPTRRHASNAEAASVLSSIPI
jgi:hypothetical protein